MKTILEQKVFNFSSLFVAACLVIPISVLLFLDTQIILGVLFGSSSIIFLLFIFRLNLKLNTLNGFISSYISTYASYTFLVILYSPIYLLYESEFSLAEYYGYVSIYLIYGYIVNIGISLIVYLLYTAIMFYKNHES